MLNAFTCTPSLPPSHAHTPTSPLPHTQVEASMKKYGKQLMNELPDETTRVLTSLCTDWIPEGSEPSENPGGVCGVCRGERGVYPHCYIKFYQNAV